MCLCLKDLIVNHTVAVKVKEQAEGRAGRGEGVSPPCCGAQSPVLKEADSCLGLYEVAKLTHHFNVLQQRTHSTCMRLHVT